MELTRERVDETLRKLQKIFRNGHGYRIDAIKIIREPFGFGLLEAKNYIDIHWDDLDFIREDLYERAGLTPETKARVFETQLFRLEVKKAGITQEQLHEFFSNVALEL